MSRLENSMRNAFVGVGAFFGRVGLAFLTKTVFVQCLGASYVGLQGFLENVVGLLNIAELGLGTAIVYSLYKTLADEDCEKTAAIMHLYRKLYYYIGVAVIFISLIVASFVPFFVENIDEFPDFRMLYVLYVCDTLLAYWFFSYRNAILQADQKNYLCKFILFSSQFVASFAQIAVLYFFHSFLAFMVISILSKMGGNLYLKRITDRMYPYLLMETYPEVSQEEREAIKKNVRAIVIYNGGAQLNCFIDTMLISYFVDIVAVGIWSNYRLIFTAVSALNTTLFSAFTASLGNLYIKDSPEKNELVFRCLDMLNFAIAGVWGIVTCTTLGDFIEIWIGKEYLFPQSVHFLLIFDFFTSLLGTVVLQFRNACGLFDKGKYRPLLGGLLNAGVSIALAQRLGICGVIIGTLINRYLAFWWFDSWLVYHNAFHMRVLPYYKRYVSNLLYFVVAGGTIVYLSSFIVLNNQWLHLLITGSASFLFAGIFAAIKIHTSDEWKFMIEKVRHSNIIF